MREGGGPAASTPAPEPESEDEAQELLEQLQRLQAEFSNYRKRILRERGEWDIRAKGEVILGMIPILDDLQRAREAHAGSPPSAEAEGLLMILSRLEDRLRSLGLEMQDTSPGTAFDPHLHEAVTSEPSEEYPEGVIISAVQPGYLFHGQLLRPARVRVSQGPLDDPS